VRFLTEAELKFEGWRGSGGAVAITLDDGGILYAAEDHEADKPGALIGKNPKGDPIVVHPTT
jgi:hypothetical protein